MTIANAAPARNIGDPRCAGIAVPPYMLSLVMLGAAQTAAVNPCEQRRLCEDEIGWGTWIRTKIDGVRVRCSTVELFPNAGGAGGLKERAHRLRAGPTMSGWLRGGF